MIKFSCLCGQVRIEIANRPDFIHECNCTLCSKSGARWSYLHPSEARVEGATQGYSRDDKDDPAAEIHFCTTCGSTTHFVLTQSAVARYGNSQMGVNMWLADPEELTGMELRYPDGRGWAGEGAFGYVRDAYVIGQ
jgi:hypothetical protein